MEKRGTTYKRPATDAAREKANEYRRTYNREHPEKVARWRLNYARKLLERAEAEKGGGNDE